MNFALERAVASPQSSGCTGYHDGA
jgi:hypothetical protein